MRTRTRAALRIAFCLALFCLATFRIGLAAPRPIAATSAPAASAFLQAESGASSHEELFKWINFLLLVGVLAYVLRRPFSNFFAERTDTIREGLDEGRKAMEAADARLGEIEGRLGRLEHDIAEYRATSEREMADERERLRVSAEREAERIAAFAQTQIEVATRAARIDLKRAAAADAVDLAEEMIRQRLDDKTGRDLVRRFAAGLDTAERPN